MCEKKRGGGLLRIYTGTLFSSVIIYIHDYLLYLNKYIYLILRIFVYGHNFTLKKRGWFVSYIYREHWHIILFSDIYIHEYLLYLRGKEIYIYQCTGTI